MIEKAFTGSKKYFAWQAFLTVLILGGVYAYSQQFLYGLGATGMSRDISWGIYIAQLTFFVGVAASAVMVVLPYYLHDFKAFGRIVVLGEFLAVASVTVCLLFVMADLGKPMRMFNLIRYPTPNSILFWDMIVLNVYLGLNLLCGWVALESEKRDAPPPKWIKPFIYLSIPWAVSIHTVTAFLYAGIPGRHFWLTAILAPRFLASAFAAGPALLILLALILKKHAKFDAGDKAIGKLATIMTYAAMINMFFLGLEFFTAYYSNIPGHMHTLDYLFFSSGNLTPIMWVSVIFGFVSIGMLLFPTVKANHKLLAWACSLLFLSLWLDKGVGLVIGGFIPNPFDKVIQYTPTLIEIMVTFGIWAIGLQMLTVFYKVALEVKAGNEAA